MLLKLAGVALLGGSALVAEPIELHATTGYHRVYLDEPGGLAKGGALRIPLTRRFAIRPEFLASSEQQYRHFIFVGSATWDFTNPEKPVVGYIVGGAGVLETFERNFSYAYVSPVILGGVGVRFSFGNYWTANTEFRIGSDAFPLVTAGLGFRFGKRQTR
jgi:hypothetical protein